MPENWQLGLNQQRMALRAKFLGKIRLFMQARDIMEVDTPSLSRYGNPDPNINSISATLNMRGETQTFYLHTSPEFAMKRLLALGSGPIYQITKVFRDDEIGRLHQPEFSMLEWYRPGFSHHDLMDELTELSMILGLPESERNSYESVFLKYLDINPHDASISTLQTLAIRLGLHELSDDRSILLEFLFSHSVSPHLGKNRPLLLYDYPACQAALSRISHGSPPLAERFELFVDGIELANGFHELSDPLEQRRRFDKENQIRKERGLPQVIIDEDFLQALHAGLPDCSGVAIGLDRLLLVLCSARYIDDVMTFPMTQA